MFVLVNKNIGTQYSILQFNTSRHFSPVNLRCHRLAPRIGRLENLLHVWDGSSRGPVSVQGKSLGLTHIVSRGNFWVRQGAQSDGSRHRNVFVRMMTEGWSVEDICIKGPVSLQVSLMSEHCWQS